MKKNYPLIISILMLLLSIGCSQSEKKSNTISYEIDGIPFYSHRDSVVKDFFYKNHIDDPTRERLKIDRITYVHQPVGDPGTEDINEWRHKQLTDHPNDNIVEGPIFKEYENGFIQEVYMMNIDNYDNLDVTSFLISYDKDGNYIDSKVILNGNSIGLDIKSKVEGDVIGVSIDEGGENWHESYTIQPDLKLKKTHNFGTEL